MSAHTLTRAPLRMRAALIIIVAVGLVLAARLFYWQIIRWDDLRIRAEAQRDFDAPILALRGDIFTSDGVVLAKDVFLYKMSVSPKSVRDPEQLATDLAPLLSQPRDAILGKLRSNEPTVILARDVPQSVAEGLIDYKNRRKLMNLEIEAKPVRLYPNNAFAAHIVGIVNSERTPAYGVEQFKNSDLRGIDGKVHGSSNVLNNPIPIDLPRDIIPATDGATITLTINTGMQRIVEQELAKAIRESGAESGSIIVMDPKTGAILALAVWPTADLNKFFDPANQGRYANQTVNAQYEPGSVFKIITVAAGLDASTITPASCFEDSGSIYIGGRTIKNHEEIAPGHVCLTDVVRQSLNVEAVKIAVGLGAERFNQYVLNFGFGKVTRIEQAGEVAGEVKQVGDGRWREVDLGTNSFGQGIAVTPIQMIAAVAAVANQGKLMKPYIVKSVKPAKGDPIETRPEVVRQVIRPETAQTLTRILADAILGESSNKATVPGYRIAGKTGTAQIPIAGILDPRWTIASFVGYLPADDPSFVILAKLDKPQSSEWGSQVASPVFASVARQIVIQAGLPPDNIRLASK